MPVLAFWKKGSRALVPLGTEVFLTSLLLICSATDSVGFSSESVGFTFGIRWVSVDKATDSVGFDVAC